MKTVAKITLAAAISLGCSLNAQATAVIGFDYTGSGGTTNAFAYADVWSDKHDTAVDQVITADNTGGNPLAGTGFTNGDVHKFSTQLRVDSFDNQNVDTSPTGMNTAWELTKEVSFLDEITGFSGTPGAASTAVFGHHADNFNNLTIWFDADITDGSTADPTKVDCYGTAGCSGSD